jgi:hypothetical protein
MKLVISGLDDWGLSQPNSPCGGGKGGHRPIFSDLGSDTSCHVLPLVDPRAAPKCSTCLGSLTRPSLEHLSSNHRCRVFPNICQIWMCVILRVYTCVCVRAFVCALLIGFYIYIYTYMYILFIYICACVSVCLSIYLI